MNSRPGSSTKSLIIFGAALGLVLGLAVTGAGAGLARAQGPGGAGPQTPPAKSPDIVRVPNVAAPTAEKPPIPVEEIIRRFAAQEDQLAQAAQKYVYRKSVRLQEFGPDGKPSGESQIVTTPATDESGRRFQRPTGEQQSTLEFLNLNRDALQALTQIPAFPLGSAQISKYQIIYQGTEPLDELTTYIFRVKPLQLERARPYFDGLIWVDNRDLAIVKSYGQWMQETGPLSPPQLPFTMYETYRQPIDKTYWMPAYSRSDGTVATKGGSVSVRLVIRWDQYTTAAPPAGKAGDSESGVPGGAPTLRRNADSQ